MPEIKTKYSRNEKKKFRERNKKFNHDFVSAEAPGEASQTNNGIRIGRSPRRASHSNAIEFLTLSKKFLLHLQGKILEAEIRNESLKATKLRIARTNAEKAIALILKEEYQ